MIYNTLWNFVWKLMLISTSEFTLANIFPNWPDFFFYSSLQANRNVHLMDMNALLTVINMMRVYYFFFWSVYWNIYKIWQCISNGVELCLIYFLAWLFNNYGFLFVSSAFYHFFFTCKWKYITSLCRFDDDI